MEVYRLTHADYVDLSGAGGLYGSGRWHEKGHLCVYTASSRALSVLERFVHESSVTLPKLKMMVIWIPDDIAITRYSEQELPKGWDALPDTSASRSLVTSWLEGKEQAVLQVPSAIVGDEYKLILNPLYSDFSRVKLLRQEMTITTRVSKR